MKIMTNLEKLQHRILTHGSDKLLDEITYYLELESNKHIGDAFEDVLNCAEEGNSNNLWNEIKKILIYVEYVKECNPSKIISTGKKYGFRYKGKYYDVVSGWEQWINS